MRASVIVPTRNRQEHLRVCLEALTALDYDDYEVVVVDDGSSDGTAELVRSAFADVLYVRQEGQGQVVARNRGIEASRGELLAFTDDDCVPARGWLGEHVSHYRDGAVGIVGGPLYPNQPSFMDRFYMAHYIDEFESLRRITGIEGWERLRTGNLSVLRAVIDRIGRFDERFLSGSDADLLRRVVRAGYTAISDPATGVEHHKTYTWPSFLGERFRKSSGSLMTDRKEGTLQWKRFFPLPNPCLTYRDWCTFCRNFGGGPTAWIRFWSLAFLTRWADVAGRGYFFWKLPGL